MGAAETIAGLLGVGISQVYFLLCQFIAIICGCLLRCYCPPGPLVSKRRHAFELAVGIFILYIGYGPNVIHLFLQAVPAYLMLVFLPLSFAQYGILIFSMTYLSGVHIYQLMTNGENSVDISAPLMVQTQKLSSLAFNINDGVKLATGTPVLRDSHRLNAINRRPRLLQLGGYLFCFHNCMIGPFMFFADYLRFIEGREADRLGDPMLKQRFIENQDEWRRARSELWKQLKLLLIHTLLTIWAFSNFQPDQFVSEDFIRKNLFQKYIFLCVACFAFRQKFYFAWTMSCVANLSAGFGFSGFDSQGQPEYRFATNIYFLAIEMGSSTKSILDAWNTATTRWLRDCIYDRVPKQYAVWAVFFASAIWHGFHSGFYLAFVSAALLTVAGRICRRYLRPYFLGSPAVHFLYDILTHVCAMFCLNYLGVAFLLQKTLPVLRFWR
ncbi:hypothetical protein P879_00130 [Paragonimus westermani]|uniref:Lysophospholipid acyltransferase 1/2 n=1 Tax=Paragonimus westermani TaxID=34504 RepID=A0A8T0DYT6_9TREM|nr:hypothetical protein P879_00130 [Paragonimus westermani]